MLDVPALAEWARRDPALGVSSEMTPVEFDLAAPAAAPERAKPASSTWQVTYLADAVSP